MTKAFRTAMLGAAVLMALSACAPGGDNAAAPSGVQAEPGQPGVTVSGSARFGVTRVLN